MGITSSEMEILHHLVGPATQEQLRAIECFFSPRLAVFIPVLGQCGFAVQPRHRHPGFMALVSQELLELPGFNREPGPPGYQLRLLPPDIPHQEKPQKETPRYYAIFLDPAWFRAILARQNLESAVFRWEPHTASDRLLLHLREFMGEYENRSDEDVLNALATLIAHEITRCVQSGTSATAAGTPSLRAAIELLEHRFDESLNLATLAHEACMSESSFLRAFRNALGMSPRQYLIKIRIRRAQQLLRTGSGTTEAARLTGFSSASHLAEAFRKQTGLTPLQYRRQELITR